MELMKELEASTNGTPSGLRRYRLTPPEVGFIRRHFVARERIEAALQGAIQLIADQQQLGGAKYQLSDDFSELVEVKE